MEKKACCETAQSLGFYFNCYKHKAPKPTNKKEGGVRKERERKMFSGLVLENKTRLMANIANICVSTGKDFVCFAYLLWFLRESLI